MEGLIKDPQVAVLYIFIFYDFPFKLHLCGLMYMCAHTRVYICLWREARDAKEGIHFLFALFVLFFSTKGLLLLQGSI